MRFETGELENYNSDKGFGFVFLKDHYRDKSVFLHISNVKNIKSQLDTPNLKLWVEVGMNNKNQNYVNRAWTSRDELPKEYLKIVEDDEAHQLKLTAKREIENELRINGTEEEQKTREEWIRTVTYLNLCPDFQREERIKSLSVTAKLFEILRKLMCRFQTTTFNHGKGTERYYTYNYCLQTSNGNCYIKRGGRPFSRTVDDGTYERKTIKLCTPSFEDMCHGILRDYRSDVLFINT